MIRVSKIISLLLLISFNLFSQKKDQLNGKQTNLFVENAFHLSEVMLHDVVNPPAAARFYSYSILGAYQVVLLDKVILDVTSKFRFPLSVSAPPKPKSYNQSFSAIYAMLEVGRQLMPSGSLLLENQKSLKSAFGKSFKMTDKAIEENTTYAKKIADQVVAYARTDGYNKLSTYKRFTPDKAEGKWYPTPPEYMAAVEPRWETIRPFFLDSAKQFAPAPPAKFNLDTASSFHQQMVEVHRVSKSLTNEQEAIANFWDCNPFAVSYSGHMAIGMKKISPGGHWLGIAGIVCKKSNVRFDSTVLVHSLLSMTLHDAFISCWSEKYSSNRLRPETAINKYLDSEWRPLLQTPPFPEYTSGHSVISSAVSVVLTKFFGDNYYFTDTSEEYFGLPKRNFKSFYQAANEAAISRLYGGIHFRDACDEGLKQGRQVGDFILRKLFGNMERP
jgi:PAP2 superfamily